MEFFKAFPMWKVLLNSLAVSKEERRFLLAIGSHAMLPGTGFWEEEQKKVEFGPIQFAISDVIV